MSWDSGLKISTKYSIVIPASNLFLCGWLRNHTNGNEFSILNRCEWRDNILHVLPDCVIPHQEVTASTVEFTDPTEVTGYRMQQYSVVTHCHPFKSDSFSGVDDAHINTNYTCSILFSEGQFTNAVIPVQIHDGLVMHLKPDTITLDWTNVDLDTSHYDLTRIIPRAHVTLYNNSSYYNNYGSQYHTCGIKKMYDTVITQSVMTKSDMDKATDSNGLVNVIDSQGTPYKVSAKLLDDTYVYDVYANEFIPMELLCLSQCI